MQNILECEYRFYGGCDVCLISDVGVFVFWGTDESRAKTAVGTVIRPLHAGRLVVPTPALALLLNSAPSNFERMIACS